MITKNKIFKVIYAFSIVIIFWYITAFFVNKPIIPYPHNVIKAIFSSGNNLYIHLFYSIKRMLSGIIISSVIGIPLGIFTGYSRKADEIFSPVVYLTYPLPKIAFLPVIMLFFGLGDFSKVFMIVLIIIFQLIVSVRDSVKNIDSGDYDVLRSLGGNKKDEIFHIIIPAIIPNILTSLRIASGTALSALFFTETFGTVYGIGYYVMDAWTRYNYTEMYAGIFVLSLLGLFIFFMFDISEKILIKWKK